MRNFFFSKDQILMWVLKRKFLRRSKWLQLKWVHSKKYCINSGEVQTQRHGSGLSSFELETEWLVKLLRWTLRVTCNRYWERVCKSKRKNEKKNRTCDPVRRDKCENILNVHNTYACLHVQFYFFYSINQFGIWLHHHFFCLGFCFCCTAYSQYVWSLTIAKCIK